ncbi:uncharacterized protein LOC128235530 [Mya arenaria]|uniref:uncharacterized protein LOC128235530 n=1 Tax=Mya arenaria TaxID=6604 RepID=UPI0022E33FBD|nr:uncharacterized protein LOC128235530 [Mya arenaria]
MAQFLTDPDRYRPTISDSACRLAKFGVTLNIADGCTPSTCSDTGEDNREAKHYLYGCGYMLASFLPYEIQVCVHSTSTITRGNANTHGYTFDQIVQIVLTDTDSDADGFISLQEFQVELLGQFDLNNDGIVASHDFINLWMAKYGDTHADTNHFFAELDANSDKELTEADILAQLSELNLGLLDILNPSAVRIPLADFENFIRINHPHGHGHGGR